jgi:hypothetical protein
MKLIHVPTHWLKVVRWHFRRATVARRWGKERLNRMPIVLGNAMPKSGSHLFTQVLQGFTHLGPFVDPGFPPVNRSENNRKLSQAEILTNIQHMLPGDIAYGYLFCEEPYISNLTHPERATIFIYRDPRDMVVSHVFYATQMHPGHWMHRYYTEELHTMEERINAAIRGVEEPGAELSSIKQRWDRYLGWLELPVVLSLRFEDLILNRAATLDSLLDFLQERGFTDQPPRIESLRLLEAVIKPQRSGTFRKGKPGNWVEHFTEANKNLFKEVSGDLLIHLDYEQDNDW